MDGQLDLILKLLEESKETADLQCQSLRAEIRAGNDIMDQRLKSVETELKKYSDAKIEQNGRIRKLEKMTVLWAWVYRNPGKSIIMFVVMVMGILEFSNHFTVVELIQKLF